MLVNQILIKVKKQTKIVKVKKIILFLLNKFNINKFQ